MNKKDPFITDKPMIDYSIDFDKSKMPKHIREMIEELEKYDELGDWLSYDLLFDNLEVFAKGYVIHNAISEADYKKMLAKYGELYD